MSHRLSEGGALIDRDRPVRFSFNGRQMQGFEGDTLASALLANGQMLVGRSFKYHRPRGLIASGIEEPNGLMTLGTGTRSEPNRVATTTELFEGLVARSQNHWPSLEHDFGAAASLAARFLPAGFYYKTFIHPRPAWKHLFEPVIRRSAGLGPAPVAADPDTYEHFYHFTDVLVVGGGIAGLTAARAAAETGARVTLLEQAPHWGGRALTDLAVLGNGSVSDWVRAELAALQAMANVTLRNRTMAAGVYDHGYVLAHERITDHRPDPCGPRHRLWRIRAGRIVLAAGALERPLAFAGNDLPGVMLASAMRDYVGLWGVAPGRRVALVTNNDDAYRSALALRRAGCEVPVILDVRPAIAAPLLEEARAHDLRVALGRGVARVRGSDRVESIEICAVQGEGMAVETVVCDALAMSGGWSPAVHLWSHCGGRLVWDEARACFRPDPDRPPTGADGAGFVIAAGSANGEPGTAAVLRDAASAGRRAAAELGFTPAAERPLPAVEEPGESAPEPVWIMPAAAPPKLREKAFLDFQNDVKVSDIQLAAREGYANVEHAKRYTTLGMATDQGKLSNINGLGVLADARGLPIPQVGTTTFRPPYANYSFGAIAGAARGPLFKPIRRAVTDGWAEARGAVFEPVGDWRRAFAYPRPGESVEAAVQREARLVRSGVGLLDASTLGKILVRGPDAATLLDRIYTNMMSSL
ncbi:MAG: FAD-dependent oxidoreductase, partial [Alphaproteobacteria bacterium]